MLYSEYLGRVWINTTLSAVYDYPLTVVEAPLGYVKTTAEKG